MGRSLQTDKMLKMALRAKTLANDFRKAVKLPGPHARASKIVKGSFELTFAGQEVEEMTDTPDSR